MLPFLGGLSALAAWRLHERLAVQALVAPVEKGVPAKAGAGTMGGAPAGGTAALGAAVGAAGDAQQEGALREAQGALAQSEAALAALRDELREAREQARRAVAHATDRRITATQRHRFLTASEPRPKGPVGITIIEGDAEVKDYAEQLRDLLIAAGYDVSDEFGTINLHGTSLMGLRVGAFSKESAPPHALPLAGSFIDSDIPAVPVINQQVAPGRVDLTVGSNPAAHTEDAEVLPSGPPEPVATPPPKPVPTPSATPGTPISRKKKAAPVS